MEEVKVTAGQWLEMLECANAWGQGNTVVVGKAYKVAAPSFIVEVTTGVMFRYYNGVVTTRNPKLLEEFMVEVFG